MLSYWPTLLYHYYSLLLFFVISSFSIGWYCGAGVFGLIDPISLSLSLAQPTFFSNNNNGRRGNNRYTNPYSTVVVINKYHLTAMEVTVIIIAVKPYNTWILGYLEWLRSS